MSLKEIFLSGIKDTKSGASAGGSILRQASRRITDKTNRDSAVINSNTDATVSQSRSTLSKPGDQQNLGSSQNQNVASSVSPSLFFFQKYSFLFNLKNRRYNLIN